MSIDLKRGWASRGLRRVSRRLFVSAAVLVASRGGLVSPRKARPRRTPPRIGWGRRQGRERGKDHTPGAHRLPARVGHALRVIDLREAAAGGVLRIYMNADDVEALGPLARP